MADSGCFGLGELLRVTRVEELLEAAPQRLAFDDQRVPWVARLEREHVNGRIEASVAPRIALRFAEGTQPSHGHTLRRTPDGSCHRDGRIRG